MSNRKVLIAALSIVATETTPAFCAHNQIEIHKYYVREAQKLADKEPSNYATHLHELAWVYHLHGKQEEAEAPFRESVKYYKLANPNRGPVFEAELIISWAQELSEDTWYQNIDDRTFDPAIPPGMYPIPKEDYARIDSTVKEGLKLIEQVPNTNDQKIKLIERAIEVFVKTGNTKESEQCTRQLLGICLPYERHTEAAKADLVRIAAILNRLADHTFQPRAPLYKQNYTLNLKDLHRNKSINAKNFKNAESLRLRSIRLLDRLPKDNSERILAHRSLALWYKLLGMRLDAVKQTAVLSSLIGSTDDAKLFPPREPCGACGMG